MWRPLVEWRWPVPLAGGLILEALAVQYGPASLRPVGQSPVVAGSWFLAGAVLFALLVTLALLAIGWTVRTLRRRMHRSARRRLARKRM
nr:hypothetical protein [uncultured Lichenicoccus sp.]